MNQEEIHKRNEAIALFMGATKVTSDNWHEVGFKGPFIKGWIQFIDAATHIDDLNYKYSWDWLMPVVEKIEASGYRFPIEANGCMICDESRSSDSVVVSEFGGKAKIDSVFKATSNFCMNIHQTTNP